MDDATEYRIKADHARAAAAGASDPVTRDSLLVVAEAWEDLARQAEAMAAASDNAT